MDVPTELKHGPRRRRSQPVPSAKGKPLGVAVIKRPKFYRVTEKISGRGSGFELLNGRALFHEHPKRYPPQERYFPRWGSVDFRSIRKCLCFVQARSSGILQRTLAIG
jgi:hypothetical protein